MSKSQLHIILKDYHLQPNFIIKKVVFLATSNIIL